jgi:PB1 domain.
LDRNTRSAIPIAHFRRDLCKKSRPKVAEIRRFQLAADPVPTAMPLIPFKLKKANAPTRLADFDIQPSWEDLASRVHQLFNIPSEHVGVAFVDKDKDMVLLTNEQELVYFYKSLYQQSSQEIKFVVQDLQYLDSESFIVFLITFMTYRPLVRLAPYSSAMTTIASTWSMIPNKSDLSQSGKQSAAAKSVNYSSGSDHEFKLFCWVLNDSDRPFSVKVGKGETVDDLKKTLKREKEYTFSGIDSDALDVWKVGKSFNHVSMGGLIFSGSYPHLFLLPKST